MGGDPARLVAPRHTAYSALARRTLHQARLEYMTGPDGQINAPAYREFALAIDPDSVNSRAWRVASEAETAGVGRGRKDAGIPHPGTHRHP